MMTKRVLIFITLVFSFGQLWAEDFDEGIEYVALNKAVKTSDPDKVVVSDVFWYGCPHCFRFKPYLHQWDQTKPEGVAVESVPSVLNPSWMNHARAYFALKLMGMNEKTHMKIFNALHLQNKRLDNVDSMAEFVADLGVDEKLFRENFHSFGVDSMVRKSRQNERKYGHRGVPAVIINGKYRTSGSMAGSNARMIKVIDYLVKKELAAK